MVADLPVGDITIDRVYGNLSSERASGLMTEYRLPLIAAFMAIAATASMDYSGYSQFSALILFPLVVIFWFILKPGRQEWGLVVGRLKDYGLAVLYPLFVIGGLALLTLLVGATSTVETDWNKTLINMAAVGLSTIVVAILTEEGFFRGTLWAALKKNGAGLGATVLFTSLAFMAWHIGWAVLPGEGQLPPLQAPVYLANAALLGAAWGLLRAISGSVIVASVSHGVWNGMVYLLFGLGEGGGALGIADTVIYGPERGVLGLVFNGAFVFFLWRKAKASE